MVRHQSLTRNDTARRWVLLQQPCSCLTASMKLLRVISLHVISFISSYLCNDARLPVACLFIWPLLWRWALQLLLLNNLSVTVCLYLQCGDAVCCCLVEFAVWTSRQNAKGCVMGSRPVYKTLELVRQSLMCLEWPSRSGKSHLL